MGWFSGWSKKPDEDFGRETSTAFDDDLAALRAAKKEDTYSFSYDFEYIEKRLGNDQYDLGTTTMDVTLIWDEEQAGYEVSIYVPEMYKIDPAEGNGTAEDFYNDDVYDRLVSDLSSYGIEPTLLVGAGIF